MRQNSHSSKSIAVVGAGPVAFGFIKELAEKIERGERLNISSIDVFDKYGKYGMGAGLPYDLESTDMEHLLNVSAKTTSDDFAKWLKDNKDKLKDDVKKIHKERFLEKFQRRFSKEFSDDLELNEEESKLKTHYDKLWSSLEKRYLDLDNGLKYHPRILLGIYNIEIFNEALDKLRDAGIEINLHPNSEIIDLTKLETGGAKLSFNGEEKDFTDVMMSTGRWRVKPDIESRKYVPEVWPISDFKEKISEIIKTEIAQRKANFDPNTEIKIAIQGNSLTAIDALKTIFKEGLFEEDEEDKLKFTPYFDEGYTVKVDMLSRGGITQQVKGNDRWLREKHDRKFPQGTEINQSNMDEIAASQDGKIRLWQVMLMLTRALENGYRIEGENEKADQARDFSKLILANVKKGEVGSVLLANEEQTNSEFDNIHGSTLSQLKQFEEKFALQLDGCNYNQIMDKFREVFFSADSMTQLRNNLTNAEVGDIEGGYLLWKNIYSQIDSLTLMKLLTPEESAYRFQVLDRYMEAHNNGMPIQTAKELIAMHEAGVFDLVTLGHNAKKPREENGKIIFESESGDVREYDGVVNTMGYSLDISRSPSAMVASMLEKKYLTIGKTLFADSDEKFEEKKEDLKLRFGDDESKRMLSRVTIDEDGKYYYSTGGYLRSPDLAAIDHAGNNLLPGVIFPGSGGVITARTWGVKVANALFPASEVPSCAVAEEKTAEQLSSVGRKKEDGMVM